MITTIKTDKLAVTPEQRANLEALAAYLEREPTEYERFSMWDCFAAEEQIEAMSPKKRKLWGSMSTADAVELTGTCPTVACALGFGIAAGIRPRLDESWIAYAERCFGAYSDIAGLLRDENEDEDAKTSHRRRLWDFLFSSAWTGVDNTRAGAAAKIRYALDRGLPSADDIERMVSGYDPPCYAAIESEESAGPPEKGEYGQLRDRVEWEP